MAKENANDLLLYVDTVAIVCLTDLEWSGSNEQIDVTCKDNDGAQSNLPGQQNNTITFSGYIDNAVATQYPAMLDDFINKTEVVARVSTGVTGFNYVEDDMFLSEFSFGGGFNEGATMSGTLIPGPTSTGIVTGTEA